MTLFDPSAAGVAGAALAGLALGAQAAHGARHDLGWAVAAVLGAVATALTGATAVLVGGWLLLAVAVRALHRDDGLVGALAFLGDAVAIAGLAALGVDQAADRLPWSGGPGAEPWTVGMVAGGLGLRAAFGSAVSPVPLVVGLTVAVRMSGSLPPDAEWLLLLAPVAVVAPWLTRAVAPGHAGALALLGLAAWGPDHPVSTGVAVTLLAGAAVVAATREFGTHADVRRVAATGFVTAAAVGAAALPVGGRPAAAVLLAATLLVVGALAARSAEPGVPRTPLAVRAGAALALGTAGLALFVPEAWWGAVGPPGGTEVVGDSLREALVRGRSGLAASLGLAAAVTGAVVAGRRRRVARA